MLSRKSCDTELQEGLSEKNISNFKKFSYLLSPWSTDWPRGLAAGAAATATTSPATSSTDRAAASATTTPAATGSTASTAMTTLVSKVDLQLERNVISWLPEVVLIVQLLQGSRKKCNSYFNDCPVLLTCKISAQTLCGNRFYLGLINFWVYQFTLFVLCWTKSKIKR